MGLGTAAALRRVAAWRSDAAVVFGSGLESLPAGATVDDELSYGELGWPSTAVPGHGNRLRLIRVPTAGGAGLRRAPSSPARRWSLCRLRRSWPSRRGCPSAPLRKRPPSRPRWRRPPRASAPTWPSPGRSSRRPPRWSGWPARHQPLRRPAGRSAGALAGTRLSSGGRKPVDFASDVIAWKRDGKELDGARMRAFVEGSVSGAVPSYQASALLMAMVLRGLSDTETLELRPRR